MGAGVDLSLLPSPDIVEALDFETILAAMKSDLIGRATAIDADLGAQIAATLALESEPLAVLLQVCAYRELTLRSRVNQAARATMLAFATGGDLDNLVANLGVVRETDETDTDLRARAALAPDGWSTAGPEGAYIFHAKSASPLVADVEVTSPDPGVVHVVILSTADDGVADSDLLAAVEAALSPSDIRPLTDSVEVVSAAVASYDVTATLHCAAGLDLPTIQAAAEAAVNAYAASRRRLNKGVALNGIRAALMQPGVDNVTLTAPMADIAPADATAPVLDTLTVTAVVGGGGV